MSLSIPKISFKHQTDKVVKDVIEVHEGIKKPDFRQTLVFPVLVEHLTAPTRDSLIVIEKIGRGAKSVVYKCLFTPTLTLIAVKCLDPISNGKEQSARLISTEINALYNLSKHELKDTFEPEYDCDVCMGDSCEFCQDQLDNLRPPLVGRSKYIVKFYESYSDDEQGICLVMEYMQGESLKTLFDRGLVATEYNLAVVAYSVLQALKEVHAQKIIHRDVKVFILKYYSLIYFTTYSLTIQRIVIYIHLVGQYFSDSEWESAPSGLRYSC